MTAVVGPPQIVAFVPPPAGPTTTPPSTQPAPPANVDFLVAARSLPPMTVVDGSVVTVMSAPSDEAPPGYISNSVEVVGKVLAAPIVKGQAFSSKFFYTDSGVRQLAATIPPGKRAVGISVSDFGSLDGMLYPGSVVDVLVTLKSDATYNTGRDTQPVAATLLENIQVLAVEQKTVVASAKTIDEMLEDNSHQGSQRRVTLLVDTRQAKVLALGMQQGTLSLALRNPMDLLRADPEPVLLRTLIRNMPLALAAEPLPIAKVPPPPPAAPHWDVIVIRGKDTQVESVPLPAAKSVSALVP
jgi:pilus assembly protein CpaB